MKKNEIKVMKFGGRALSSTNSFFSMADILYKHKNTKQLIIVSALEDTTRMLKKAAQLAENLNSPETKQIIENIYDKHFNYANQIISNHYILQELRAVLTNYKSEIQKILEGVNITNELTARTLDLIMSYGEKFALQLVYHFLKEKNFSIRFIEAEKLIVTNNNYNYASPLYEDTLAQCKDNLFPLLDSFQIVITQGFVGTSKSSKQTTTLGMESSNLSAALLSAICNTSEITFWTDVEGFRSCDPKLINNTKPVKSISYKDARLLADNGFKLIFPKMIDIAIKSKIRLIYKSIFSPDGDFTEIAEKDTVEKFTHIIYKIDHLRHYSQSKHLSKSKEKHLRFKKTFPNGLSKICIFNTDLEKLIGLLSDIYKMNNGNLIHFNINNDSKIQEITLNSSISNKVLEFIHENL